MIYQIFCKIPKFFSQKNVRVAGGVFLVQVHFRPQEPFGDSAARFICVVEV
jgi:hypothetical protein